MLSDCLTFNKLELLLTFFKILLLIALQYSYIYKILTATVILTKG